MDIRLYAQYNMVILWVNARICSAIYLPTAVAASIFNCEVFLKML